MPSRSIAQMNLMRAAEHGANFPMAKKIRKSMTKQQMHDFASEHVPNAPAHVSHHSPPASSPTPLMKGVTGEAVHINMKSFKAMGMNEHDATKAAIKKSKPYANQHERLGKYLHPRKDGKPHGSTRG